MRKAIPAIIPVISLLGGIYWVYMGFDNYGFWVRKGPGGGFMPVVGGTVVIIFSILVLNILRKEKSDFDFTWKAFIPAGALLGMVLCSYLLGMIISMALYIFVWLKFVEKHKLLSSLLISLCVTASIYAIFIGWLSVPMPKGLLGIL